MARSRVESRIFFRTLAPKQSTGGATLTFDARQPYEVRVDFGDDNVWSVGRDLLGMGVQYPAGLGDVRLWPLGDLLYVALSSHEGVALLTTDRNTVQIFLNRTYKLVGKTAETVDVDSTVAVLLDDEHWEEIRERRRAER